MQNSSHIHDSSVKRCAICGGKFGLIRHYYWRTPVCSEKCVERFKTRRKADQDWFAGCNRLNAWQRVPDTL